MGRRNSDDGYKIGKSPRLYPVFLVSRCACGGGTLSFTLRRLQRFVCEQGVTYLQVRCRHWVIIQSHITAAYPHIYGRYDDMVLGGFCIYLPYDVLCVRAE